MRTIAAAAGLFFAASAATGDEAPALRDLLDRVDDLFRGASSRARVTMTITTANWSRELTVEIWSQGKEKSLMRILRPKKEEGTATLKVGRDLWNFLPKVDRIIKLPSSMMGASWMGSHFTNDDLVKENRMADDYRYEMVRRWERDGARLGEIACVPKPSAAVVWGKVLLTVRLDDAMPQELAYYDEEMVLARTMTFSDFREMGGRLMPAVTRIEPADKPGEFTQVRYEAIAFDVEIPPGLFSLRSLRR